MFGTLLGSAVLGPLLEVGKSIIDKIPDSNLREKLKAEYERALLDRENAVEQRVFELAKGQLEINTEEAKSENLFVSGWRPAVGWVGVGGLAYQFILSPLIFWFCSMLHIAGPPALDAQTLITLLCGILGLGGLRTYEKKAGVVK